MTTIIEQMAKAVGKALWHNEPDRPFTDEVWERELRWWRKAKAEAEDFPMGDVSYTFYADKCFRVASAVLAVLAESDLPQTLFDKSRSTWNIKDADEFEFIPDCTIEHAFHTIIRAIIEEQSS